MSFNEMTPLPWQTTQWHHYQQCRQQQRVPHAWLLSGVPGMGKYHFAKQIAQSQLCVQPQPDWHACGHCRSCQLFSLGHHPDCTIIEPEKAGGSIKIEQIRDLQTTLLQTSQFNGERIAIITPAEAMNHAAMNALLKLLEEPPKACRLVLLSDHPALLLATIRSRCQSLSFHTHAQATTETWLQQHSDHPQPALLLALAGGAPFKALALAQPETWQMRQTLFKDLVSLLSGQRCPIQLAKQYTDAVIEEIVGHFLSWLRDIVQYKTNKCAKNMMNIDLQKDLKTLAERSILINIYTLYDRIIANRRLLLEKININLHLLLEVLFIEWLEVVKK